MTRDVSLIQVPITVVGENRDLDLPSYATSGSVGLDLRAAISSPIDLASMQRQLIPTGIAIALPTSFEGQIRPRSGLALEHGVTVLNAPGTGTIDSDYRGEIGVILINLGLAPFHIERGDRIAQLVVCLVALANWSIVDGLEPSDRGASGFGLSGH